MARVLPYFKFAPILVAEPCSDVLWLGQVVGIAVLPLPGEFITNSEAMKETNS